MISSKVKYSPPCRGDNRKSIIARGSGICQNIEKAAKADLLEVNNKSAFFIRNIKKYLLTALYNAPLTIENYYAAQINHDLYGRNRGDVN